MLALNANREQIQFFNKLIQEIDAQVVWNGHFVIMGDRLVIEGFVRSLVFHFDIQKTETALIDLDVDEDEVVEMEKHPQIQDFITMAVYVFGKWGCLKGFSIDQEAARLDQIFQEILAPYDLSAAFDENSIQFYRDGLPITYEDVIETAFAYEKRSETDWDIILPKARLKLPVPDTASAGADNAASSAKAAGVHTSVSEKDPEAAAERIEKYHSRLGVLDRLSEIQRKALRRDITYDKLLNDQEKEELLFPINDFERQLAEGGVPGAGNGPTAGRDPEAAVERIEKYRSRLGVLDRLSEIQRKALRRDITYDRLLNDGEKAELIFPLDDFERQLAEGTAGNGAGTAGRDPEAAAERSRKYRSRLGVLDRLSEIQRKALRRDITYDRLLNDKEKAELIFPLDDFERQLAEGTAGNGAVPGAGSGAGTAGRDPEAAAERSRKYRSRLGVLDRLSEIQRKALRRDITYDRLLNDKEKAELLFPLDDFERQLAEGISVVKPEAQNGQAHRAEHTQRTAGTDTGAGADVPERDSAAAARIEKYHTRISVLDRLSVMQRKALLRDITYDRLLNDTEKKELVYPIEDFEYQEKMQTLDAEFEDSSSQTYVHVQNVIKRTQMEDLSEKLKAAVLEKLYALRTQWGSREVRQIMEHTPMHVERDEYQMLQDKLAVYEDIDLSPYKDRLRQMRETLEIKEISNMIVQSPKKSREDFMQLLRQIEAKDFAKENAVTYIESILGWVHDLDAAEIKNRLFHTASMDFDTAASVYEQIQRGKFLPDIKSAALAEISKRLKKLRMDECGILSYSLWLNLPDGIRKNPRYHFSPSEKIAPQTAEAEEQKIIENALSAYAKERGTFEYPVLTVDTSKDGSGEDGMLITQENLFYGVGSSSYKVPLAAVKSIQDTSGLLNSRLILEETNGIRHKLPYAVEPEELPVLANILDKFVRYLKQKPVSEKLAYKEPVPDEIQCGRCGCIYSAQERCPECGYKKEA